MAKSPTPSDQTSPRSGERIAKLLARAGIASRREVMGELVNPHWLTAVAGFLASLIIALNVFLLYQVFFG